MTDPRSRLTDKTVLVTGAASGIGRAIALAAAAEGANLVAGDIDEPGLAALSEELGDHVAAQRADVCDEADQEALVALATERFGGLDVAVANAGGGFAAPIIDHDLAMWRGIIDLCLTGAFLTVKHAGRAITERGGGCIITVASLNAIQPGQGMAAYCAAKAGVAMLTEVAALELGPQQVRVNAVAPGLVMTNATAPLELIPGAIEEYVENTPLGRYGEPEEIAEVVLFLASDDSSFMNGALVSVDGGARTQRYPDLMAAAQRMGEAT